MTDDPPGDPPTDRESPVGEPVIRGDSSLFGSRAEEAVQFDPDDPESVTEAAETVRAFADNEAGATDNVYVLRGAAACAALVRAEGSYKAAAERAAGAGEEPRSASDGAESGSATVAFIRKWARVHDLPYAVRKHVAVGQIAPTAAKHIARVAGDARLYIAWALLDNDLTVREVRRVASAVNDGTAVEAALRDVDVAPGRIAVGLPANTYLELRRQAALDDRSPDEVVADALAEHLD